jgi:hypothetical protein
LSLRNNQIDDEQAKYISLGLGDIRRQNSKLLTLNLNGNLIGNEGAIQIARVKYAKHMYPPNCEHFLLYSKNIILGFEDEQDIACFKFIQ